MSFGFSCIDVLSSAKLAVDGKHCAQHVTLGSSKIRWRLLLSDMTIIAKACERVSISLDVYFICEEELRSQGPTLSRAIVDHWFEMGQKGWSSSPLHPPASSLQDLGHKASRLAHDLEQKATGRRLILVCQKLSGSILIEALTRKSSTTRGKWLLGRIAGIVFIGPIQLRDCSKRESSVEGFKCPNTGTVHSPERPHSPIFPDRPRHGAQGVEHLPGFINTITIRLDDKSSLTMRRSYSSTSLCSRNSSPDPHRTQIMDIRCSREEFSDCRLWSIIRLIQGETLAISGLDAMGSHLNSVAQLKRFTCTIKHALNQGSPTRQDMVSQILSWTAWSMRPLESQEMFAAITTRTTLGIFARYRSDLHGNPWPATEEDLISFCPEILEIRQGGQVAFRNEQLRLLIRSPLSRDLGFASAEAIHESMAAVCFHHLGCLHKETILRPWINTGSMLRCEIRQCHFRSYCTNYWQDHYRTAEASSRQLVAMLHSTLETALNAVQVTRAIDPISRMSTGIWICSLWDLEILGRTYLEMGADVNYRAGSNEAPLHVAAANSSMKMLRLLLDRGASLEVRDCCGFTALQQACQAGASNVVALLLQKGADPESSYDGDKNDFTSSIPLNRTPLHLAASSGYLDIVKALLEAGSDINALTADSRATALHFAVEHGKEDVVRYLIDLGADMEAENSLTKTALETAIKERRDVMVRLLVDRGAKPLLGTPQDAAYLATVLGNESLASAVHHFQSLSLKNASVFPYEIPSINSNISKLSNETVAEYGWTIIDKGELEK